MVGTAVIRADFLTNCIEAAATVGAGNGCDGKSWRLHDSDVCAYDHVDTISRFMYFSIGFAIINPPCAQGKMQDISLHPRLIQTGGIAIGHIQNIGKAWVPFGAAVAGRIFRLSGKHSHFNQGNNLPLELVKGKIQSFS